MFLPFRAKAAFLVSWSCLLVCHVAADQIVYLNRTGNRVASSRGTVVWEPFFFPKSINASVGEQVHFVGLFNDITGYLLDGTVCLSWDDIDD
jgi:hypothetical protein